MKHLAPILIVVVVAFFHKLSAQTITYSSPIDLTDHSNVSFDQAFDISSQLEEPEGIAFSSDGTKMFVLGSFNFPEVNQYSLTLPYDISSGVSFDGSLDISGQAASPYSIAFNSDGTKMYICGDSEINQYSLSSSFTITSGVTFDNNPFNLTSQEGQPTGMTFNSDGTKMFVTGFNNDNVYQYSLTTPYNTTSGVSHDGNPLDISSELDFAVGIDFNGDGTRLFIVNSLGGRQVKQYGLSTPYIVTSGVTYEGNSPFLFEEDLTPRGIAFNTTGTKMFVTGRTDDEINQYSLSSNVFKEPSSNDASVNGSLTVSISGDTFVNSGGILTSPTHFNVDNLPADLTPSMAVMTDGLSASLTLAGNATELSDIPDLQLTFTDDAFTISNASAISNAIAATSGLGIDFNSRELSYISPINLDAGVSFDGSPLDLLPQDQGPGDITFSADGTIMYMVGITGTKINRYNLTTPFDITSGVSFYNFRNLSGEMDTSMGMVFNNDGTKMFIVGRGFFTSAVHQYTFTASPYNILNAAYNGSFNVTSQDFQMSGITFNNDGTKMFLIGDINDQIHQYSLTTPFEVISGVSYDGSPFSVASEEITPTDVVFNVDGSKMFVTGTVHDEVSQYDLTTPFDITSGVSLSRQFDVSSEEGAPFGVAFNPDGTKMYVVGSVDDEVNQYTLSNNVFIENDSNNGTVNGSLIIQLTNDTFINAGGALTSGIDYSISNLPSGLVPDMAISSDGLSAKLTLSGNADDHGNPNDINDLNFTFENSAFTVSDAIAVANAVSNNSSFGIDFNINPVLTYRSPIQLSNPVSWDAALDISSEESFPQGFTFSPDGLKMFVVGANDSEVNQYSLTNPFDITSGVTFDGSPFDISSEETIPTGIAFNTAGTRMFISGIAGGSEINQYSLTTPFDVTSGVTFDGSSYSVATEELFVQDFIFNLDGTKLFIVGSDGDEVNQYSLTTPFDITSGVLFDGNPLDISNEETDAFGIAFNAIGTKLFISGQNGQEINQYILSIPYDITSGVTANASYDLSAVDPTPTGIAFNITGTKLLILGLGFGAEINQFSLSTGIFTESTANDGSVSGELHISITDDSFTNQGSTLTFPTDFSITNLPAGLVPNLSVDIDGLSAILTISGNATNHQEVDDLTDLQFTFENSAFVGNNVTAVFNAINVNSGFGIDFSENASLTYRSTIDITDATSISFAGNPFDISAEDTGPQDIAFSKDGYKMFILGVANDIVIQYSLVTPFETTGGVSLDGTTSIPNNAGGLTFNSDGTKMYIMEFNNDEVYQYSLTTPFDITAGISSDGAPFDVTTEESSPFGIAFNANGTKMFIVGSGSNQVNQYTLSSPYETTSGVTFDGTPFDVSAETVAPVDISFNPTGTKMFVVGQIFQEINQYSLLSPFDVTSGGSFDGTYSVSIEDQTPRGVSFNFEGTKMFIVGADGDQVYQYNLGPVTFNEVSANDGSVQGELLISIADDSFTNPGSTLAYSTDFNIINLPAALVPNLSVASDGLSAILTISGNATNHQEDDNLDNIIFTFENSAFVGDNSSAVFNSTNANSGFGISFDNNPRLTYSSSIDLSNPVSFDGSPLDLSSEESFPQGFTFSPDGLKMFVVGANDSEVNQYSLTNPFDITSGVTFDGSPFDVSSEETVPTGIAFNSAGTRMFISGIAGGSEINQYSNTTPFDVTSGVTFDGSSHSVATEELFVQDLKFNLDGTKLFIVGSDGDEVNQYSLTSPFDITSGVSFDGNSLDISNEETDAFGIAFNALGTKLFISGQNGQEINQYHLDNPFDITSGVTTDIPYDISSIDPTPTGIAFNNTGTKLLVIGLGFGAEVNQFSLSTNVFTESTANDGSVSGELLISITDDTFTNPGSTLAYPTDFSITNLPTGLTPNLAVANDGLTATLNFAGTADNHLFSDDVDELIFTFENSAFTGNNASAVNDAIVANSNFGIDFISSSETDILSFSFPEQTSVAVIDDVNHTIEIEVATLTDISALVGTFTLSDGATVDIEGTNQVSGITANSFLNSVIYSVTADDEVTTQDWTVTVSVDIVPKLLYAKSPDISEKVSGSSISVSAQDPNPGGISFNDNGMKLYLVGSQITVFEYDLISPFELTGATLNYSLDVSGIETNLQAISFNNDGTKMFLLGAANGVNQYYLSTPYDISTATYINSFSVLAQDISPFGFAISSTGARMYVVGNYNDNVYEYLLSTPFDVNTAVFNTSFSVASFQEVPTDIYMSKDGGRLYLTGFTGAAVNELSLSTPFDLSTASHTTTTSVVSEVPAPHAITFNSNASKMFVSGQSLDEIVEYDFGQDAFVETSLESGIVEGELIVSIIHETFTNPGGMLTFGVDFTINNLPSGLNASMSVSSDGRSAVVELSGTAASHGHIDDVDELNFTFQNSAFSGSDASAVSNAINASSNLGIDFLEDNPPVFTSSDVADFNENGTGSVLDIDANDGDGGIDDDNITYAINGGADQTLFNLDINDGVLTFISSPDYDNPNDANTDNDYELEISADDGINTTIQSVVITVLDVNEDPVFTSKNTADFDENATGAVIDVDANDGDTGTNDQGITYSISGGDDQSEFNIDEDNGMLTFLTAPDFEDPQDANVDNVYEVQVTADDGVNTADQLLTITIIDLMDIPSLNYAAGFNIQTAFLNDTRSVIDEEDGSRDVEFSSDGLKMYLLGSGNTIIHQYSLSDPFQISTATFMDTFIDAQGSSGFSLAFNNDGSLLFVLGNNEDEVNQYILSTPWEINTATFSQSISITNDEPDPSGLLFNNDGTSMFVSGTFVSEFTLTSPFDISTAVFSKSFTPVAYAMDVSFSNDGSRMLIVDVVDNVLQYDLSAPYDVTTASPQSESKFIGSDGNAPHGFTFDPDFTSMFIADAAIDAINEYKSATAFFESSSNDGSVIGTIAIKLVNGSFSNADGNLTLPTDYTISNLPTGLTPNLSISANAKSAILTLTGNASNHQELNGVTDLIFSFESSAFEGNDATEIENAVNFNTNLGIVFDDNPNTDPTISDQIFSIDENATFGTNIGTVVAADADSDPLTYSITNGNTNDAFAIDASTGSLTVNSTSALNFETTSSFALIVEVNDGNGGIADATITVNLLDINESPLISDQTFSIDENSPFGAIVGTVVATDPENDPLTYSISSGNAFDAFALNPTSGELIVNNSSALDFESRQGISVDIQVDDGNGGLATADIIVNLNDVEEGSNTDPIIEDQTFAIDENSPFGSSAGIIIATDNDGDVLFFAITSGNTNNAFSIDSGTGDLTVNTSSALDFETTPSFSLTVEVNDGKGGIANATIIINLNDVDENENAEPVITDQSFSIDENSPNGASVGTVIATDEDGDALTYSITNGNTNNAFAIGSSTGDLTVKTTLALDFETTPSFALNVEVNDGNGGIANATITINLKEIEEATGIKNLDQLMDIYPNPFTNKLIIELKQISKDYNIILTDISGKTLKSFNGDLPNELIMDLSGLSDGLYILHIETSLSNAVIRVLKKAN